MQRRSFKGYKGMAGVDPNFLSMTMGEVITYFGGGGAGILSAVVGGNYMLRRRREGGGSNGNGKSSNVMELRVANIEVDVKEVKSSVRDNSNTLHSIKEDIGYLRGKADQAR